MSNKEKFLNLVNEHDTSLLNEIESRLQKRKSLQRSKAVAVRILYRLDELNMSQKDLAEKLNVAPQQVNKWVKGGENFTFETIEKIENALGFELMYISETPKTNAITIQAGELKDFNDVEMKRTTTEAKVIPLNPTFPCVTPKCNLG